MSELIVDSVNEYAYFFDENQPGVSVGFHSATLKNCTLHFAKNNLQKGFVAEVKKLGEGEMDITCFDQNDNHFALSPNQPTSAIIEILSVEPTVKIKLVFNLYNVRKKIWLEQAEAILAFKNL